MDLDDGHLYGCSMTQGTIENPANNVIELARISQNCYFDDMCVCDECENNGCSYATRHEDKYDEELFNDCLYEQILESLPYNGFTQENIDAQLTNIGYGTSFTVSFDNVAEVLEAVVKPHGNGARVNVPKKYVGRKVKVVILHD